MNFQDIFYDFENLAIWKQNLYFSLHMVHKARKIITLFELNMEQMKEEEKCPQWKTMIQQKEKKMFSEEMKYVELGNGLVGIWSDLNSRQCS